MQWLWVASVVGVALIAGCQEPKQRSASKAATTAAAPATTLADAGTSARAVDAAADAAASGLGFAPPFDGSDVEGRYALATTMMKNGETAKALALLGELITKKDCPACSTTAMRALVDAPWKPVWMKPALWKLVHSASGTELSFGRDDSDETCPNGLRLKRKALARSGNSSLWCENKKGIKHGPYMGLFARVTEWTETGIYDNGARVGWWDFFTGGHEWSVGRSGWVVDGVPQGLWRGERETSAGRELEWATYEAGVLHGTLISLDENGKTVQIASYRAGVLDGDVMRRDGNWQINGAYLRGKKHGEWTVRQDGVVRERGHWKAGLEHGDFEFLDDKGKRLAKLTLENGSGRWIGYDDAGDKVSEGALKNGLRVGTWKLGAKTREEGAYKRGVRAGVWRVTNEENVKIAVGPYRNGRRHGRWQLFHDNGKPRASGTFKNGKATGRWRFLHDDGALHAVGTFADGRATGTWVYRDPDGEIEGRRLYRRGRMVKDGGEDVPAADQGVPAIESFEPTARPASAPRPVIRSFAFEIGLTR